MSAYERCPLILWEVKNAVFERRNPRDHSLCPLMGGVRLREVSVSGGSTVFQVYDPRSFQRCLNSSQKGLKNHRPKERPALIAQLAKHCTGKTEVRVRVQLRPEFFRPLSLLR